MADLSGCDDKELLRRHATGGDRDAFGELFRRHRDRLWAVALRTLSDPEEAADALQDAMVNAYRAAARFRGDSAVTTWLHRIVVNACLDRVRRKQARPAVPMSDQLPEPAMPGADPADAAGVLAVRQALAELPFDQRAVVVYIDMLGYPVADVAAILEIPAGTVKSRASRARSQLATLLSEIGNRAPAGDVGPIAGPDAGDPATTTSGKEEKQ
ncbi:RNA polymerase sigma factor SigM [Stackebrandtia nassauensis]|uniref:RNA polymerase, sigma-24 subunit, ECF subfamily n=1 Tax=Stackebrandtia nassauensis (strain DSM 44728 / CIP 108903 / NRRL B-16338 / NBRC 102104 / LLR-40K-21) TaxID=446470 RepID=D3Q5I9_STANL|nr:RNA polymerase sigma factor SigM [Stackebrandtia nassauensis]ADD46049.1 RNA polymerase, sigma-24 subunit, ECF subfamily [Stackebrandtia nassauensis DSM 44728]